MKPTTSDESAAAPDLWFHEFGWVGPIADADEFMALMIDGRKDRRYVYGGSVHESEQHDGYPAETQRLEDENQLLREAISDALADLTPGIAPHDLLDRALKGGSL
jgi:hypothetical protein